MVGLPLLLILILDSALDTAFELGDIEKSKVIYINNDNGEMSEQFTNLIKDNSSKEIKSLLDVSESDDLESAKEQIKEEKSDFIIEIENGYSEKVVKEEKAYINIYTTDEGSVSTVVMQNIVNSFNSMANVNLAINSFTSFESNNYITEEPISAESSIPSAMDYYAVTMLVLIIMYGALYAVYSFSEDYIDHMRNRLLTAPLKLWQHFIGKILGVIFTVFLQIVVLILFTKFAFDVNWGDKPLQLIIIAFTLSVFSVSFGMLFTMIFKDKNQANGILQFVIPIMTFLSGGYVKFNFESELSKKIIYFIPNKLGQTAFFNMIYGDYANQIFSSVGAMWIMIFVIGFLSILLGRRKLA
jgi:ABC-2 type transport system permease protein